MLENATVTMPYKELQELLNKIDEHSEIVKIYNRDKSIEAFEADPYKQTLDEVCALAEKASECTEAAEKQYFIYKIMLEYCKVFKIPEKEIMEGTSEGTEPKK